MGDGSEGRRRRRSCIDVFLCEEWAMILRYSIPGSTISQFLDAKIRLRNRAEPGTFGGVCARSRQNELRKKGATTEGRRPVKCH